MPRIGLIWAQTTDGVIGRDGDMPWRAPEDMAYFKRTTLGHPVIMGRRTWESIPPRFRPFSERTNIVLTHDDAFAAEVREAGGLVAADVHEALALAGDAEGGDEIWVVGGGSVYEQFLPEADQVLVTVLDLDVSDGDTHAPLLPSEFVLTAAAPGVPDFAPSDRGPAYRFETWTRRG
jgi:dihydrofolate reductase